MFRPCLLGDRIVGGLILFDNGGGEWELGRIYIDPDYQNRAIGQRVLRKMYQLHSDVKRWRLGTPEWATRNQHLYQKMGFTVLEVTALDPDLRWRSMEYEKTLPVGIGDQQIDQSLTGKDAHPSVEAPAVGMRRKRIEPLGQFEILTY